MGVPKFYRFISERYPLINTKVIPGSTPRIDNLYLDMNGIIHNCSRHTSGNGPIDSKRYTSSAPSVKSPQHIFLDVCKYIDNIFSLVPPCKLLYMAIDGVAPRAKMNQQRARRFRSAKERQEEHQRLTQEDPMYAAAAQQPFDSNCITPGTEFMHNLSTALAYFVAKKVTEDRRWASIEVILSGAESPGEGEHKIMEYIRAMRESGHLKPNTRHCVYGLDADLIMLGLVTHEPHFFVLREKVDFTFWRKKGGPRVASMLDTTLFGEFEFLSIGVLREYLALELGANGNSSLPFFDVERIADDFVFILMLIGNDFLPNLPTLDIADGTLSVMLHLYKRLLPVMGGYLTASGKIIPQRLEYFLAKLGMIDKSVMLGKLEAEEQASRGRRKGARNTAMQNVDLDYVFGLANPPTSGTTGTRPLTLKELRIQAAIVRVNTSDPQLLELKKSYYSEKLGEEFRIGGSSAVRDLAQSYVEGIWWTLRYYTEGCRHWRWFYPFHYAPFASDIYDIGVKLAHYESTTFVSDDPFRPLEQLLSVLPPVSAWCLPKPYRSLMTSASSPIRDHYPAEFATDLNGKRNDWEAVVLLPFVDEGRLLKAVGSIPIKALCQDEVKRNNHGPSFSYKYSLNWEEEKTSPFGDQLPSFSSKAKRTKLALPKIPSGKPFTSRPPAGTLLPHANEDLQDLPFLGVFKFNSRLDAIGVNVFGTPSRSESVLLIIGASADEKRTAASGTITDAAGTVASAEERGLSVDDPVWFGYPWRVAGWIDSIAGRSITKRSTKKQRAKESVGRHQKQNPSVRETNKSTFARDAGVLLSTWFQKFGVVLPHPMEIIGVRAEATVGKTIEQDKDESSATFCDTRFVWSRAPREVVQAQGDSDGHRLQRGQKVIYAGSGPYCGMTGTVRSFSRHGMVRVEFSTGAASAREPAFGYRVVSISSRKRWLPLSKLAAAVGLPVSVADAFLGSVRVRLLSGKEEIDLGLGIKYAARGLHIPGYARRDERQSFSFSEKAVDLLHRYRAAFRHLFDTVESFKVEAAKATNGRPRGNVVYSTRDIFGQSKKADDAARAAATWISMQEVAKLPLVSVESQVVSRDTVLELEKHGSIVLALQAEYGKSLGVIDVSKRTREVTRQSLLIGEESLRWDFAVGSTGFMANTLVPADGSGLRLGDRVVNRMGVGSVPFGLRGTVVGIHPHAVVGSSDEGNRNGTGAVLVEVVFDEGFIGGGSLNGRCTSGRGKAVPAHSLLIIRPDRENQFYVKNYARIAAKTALTSKRSSGGSLTHDNMSEAVATASVLSYAEAVRKKMKVSKLEPSIPLSVHAGSDGIKTEQEGSKEVANDMRLEGPEVNTALLPVPSFVNGSTHEVVENENTKCRRGPVFTAEQKPVVLEVEGSRGRKAQGEDEASLEAARLTEMLKRDLGIENGAATEGITDGGTANFHANDRDTAAIQGGSANDDLVKMWEQLQREETGQR